jgi:hypothetical protein
MKKQKIKFNKSKLVARVMLVILLVASALNFGACGKGWSQFSGCYYSHTEFMEFVKEYNSINDGEVLTFLSIDLDDVPCYKCYEVAGVTKTKNNKLLIYDKYMTNGVGVMICIYLDDVDESGTLIENAYQIVCVDTNTKHKYYSIDSLSLFDSVDEEPIYIQYGNRSDVFYNPTENAYNHIQTYNLNTNGNTVMQITIASLEKEMSQEKLDEIIQMLYDRLVIINTEG